MSTVLITGAAGFLGSHLADRYLDLGWHVLGVDDFSSSSRDSRHLGSLKARERFQLFDLDITDSRVLSVPRARGLDLILNFACPASPPVYQSMPIKTMMTCVLGTKHVLELASMYSCPIVHASTSEVYGDPSESPQTESYRGNVNSFGPRACYDEGKRAAEALCWDYLSMGIDARLVRIFNTYGPRMDPHDGRVVSNFVCQALRNERLTIYGDGTQTRSLCYVSDLINGIFAMASLKNNPGVAINLGNPVEMSISSIASRILNAVNEVTGRRLPLDYVEYRPYPVDDPARRCPDINRARTLLKWTPTVRLDDGIKRTIEHFQDQF